MFNPREIDKAIGWATTLAYFFVLGVVGGVAYELIYNIIKE